MAERSVCDGKMVVDTESNSSSSVQSMVAICDGISKHRAKELLEAANGSLERAIDIFFHQQQQEKQPDEVVTPEKVAKSPPQQTITSNNNKRSLSRSSPNTPKGSGAKQARLASFFSARSKNSELADEDSPNKRTAVDIKEKLPFDAEVIDVDDYSPVVTQNVHDRKDALASSSEGKAKSDTAGDPLPSTPVEVDIDEGTCTSKKSTEKKSSTSLQSARSKSPPRKDPVKLESSFQRLAETLQQMADTTKRLVKLRVLETFIRDIIATHTTAQGDNDSDATSKVLTCALQLVLGLRSSTEQAPLDVSGSAVSKALQLILGVSRNQLSKVYRQYGDFGDSAASFFQKKSFFVVSTRHLSIVQVYQSLQDVVATSGRDAKQHILLQLLRSCNTKTELRFLVRLLIGSMRVGANIKTVLAALAQAIGKEGDDIKVAVSLIQKTHDICPNLEKIIGALVAGGLEQMEKECGIQLLTPIAPMLAHPVHSLDQVEKVMNETRNSAVMEWKYDGVRCQAHYDGSAIKLFSRHMLETTAQYPDAAKSLLDAIQGRNVHSFILDAEIVGVEGEGDKTRLLPFQDLSRRKRKNDDGQGVRVKVFAFDVMYLNGESFVDKPLWERQQALFDGFEETKDFAYVSSQKLASYNEPQLREYLQAAFQAGAEGLMLKMLGRCENDKRDEKDQALSDPKLGSPTGTSPYEAGTRSHSWLKVKRDYVDGYADTIDVVPIGAWYGNGRKAQKSFLSPVLLAVYDEEEDVYRSISRCMSFTDNMYEAMREFYFRGTPYPPHLGIDGSDGGQEAKTDLEASGATDVVEGEESDSDKEASENDFEGGSDAIGAEKDTVNCHPGRPSSAFVITNESPPIWFKPLEVFEVSFADMSLSRQHTAAAGLVDDPEGRGVALRFPRFKRRRPDKRPAQATTCAQIAHLFANQSKQGSSARRTGSR